jgi:hypothetical protein
MTKILLVRHGHIEGISPEYVHKRIRGDWALPPTRPATPKRCSAIVVHHPQAKYFAV